MADEFVAFLVIGLVIIAAMLIATFAGYGFPEQDRPVVVPGDSESQVKTKNITVMQGLVGDVNVEVYNPISLDNIDVSFIGGIQPHTLPDRRLVNGLLFGSNEIRIDVNDLEDVLSTFVEFEVIDTNTYGPLNIKIITNETEKVLNSQSYNLGKQKIFIDQSWMKGDVTIEIKPVSSGWFIWAPTVYDIKDVKIVIEALRPNAQTFAFSLTDDMVNNFQRGWIAMDLPERVGEITIELNEKEQYKDEITQRFQKIEFDENDLEVGENKLQIYAAREAATKGSANLVLFYRTTKTHSIEQSFDVSSNDYSKLNTNPGRVEFRVTDVYQTGAILLKINGNTVCKSTAICYPTPQANVTYVYQFNKTHAISGENTLAITSLDNVAFRLEKLKIRPVE